MVACPASCPAGHRWAGTGQRTTSYSFGEYSTACWPADPLEACPWVWIEPTSGDPYWDRTQMSARWHPSTGRLLPTNGSWVEILVDGQWRPGVLCAWRPVPGAGWEAEVAEGRNHRNHVELRRAARLVPPDHVRR